VVSTLADWLGACTTALTPLTTLLKSHVLAAERLRGDDTTVPVLARQRTITGPFGGPAPPAAIFHYSRDRGGERLARSPRRRAGHMDGASCSCWPM
jgi:transposase